MLLIEGNEVIGRRILIVERESAYAQTLAERLKFEGADIVGCVTSGVDAISFVCHSRVDAVVIDLRTLATIPFFLNMVMSTFGVEVIAVASFDTWFDHDDGEANDKPTVDEAVDMPTVVIQTKDRSRVQPSPYVLTISERRPWSPAD